MRLLLAFIVFSNALIAQTCFQPWNSSTAYIGASNVSHNGRNYTAKWWTQNNEPGNAPSNVWTDNGACNSCNTPNPGTIGTDQSIAENTIPNTLNNITTASGGNGSTYTYQWQKSTNNNSWTDISGANATDYSPGVLATSTFYRRKVTSGNCGEAFTTSIFIRVNIPCIVDADGDGVCDDVDLDDDNDGILDEEECPTSQVSTTFQTNGGTTTTFNAPSADLGFEFYIYSLDNSFNLNVNGVKLVPDEIQCSGSGANGESVLVFESDNSGFGQSGNANVWTINGTNESPVIKLKIVDFPNPLGPNIPRICP